MEANRAASAKTTQICIMIIVVYLKELGAFKGLFVTG